MFSCKDCIHILYLVTADLKAEFCSLVIMSKEWGHRCLQWDRMSYAMLFKVENEDSGRESDSSLRLNISSTVICQNPEINKM